MNSLSWLDELSDYIKNKSFGLAAIRVLDYNGITFGIIEPYGYYIINYKSEIYLLRSANVSIKFRVQNEKVVASVVHTGQVNISYIDALFASPPAASSKLKKFVLYRDRNPRTYTAIKLINRCLDLRILSLA